MFNEEVQQIVEKYAQLLSDAQQAVKQKERELSDLRDAEKGIRFEKRKAIEALASTYSKWKQGQLFSQEQAVFRVEYIVTDEYANETKYIIRYALIQLGANGQPISGSSKSVSEETLGAEYTPITDRKEVVVIPQKIVIKTLQYLGVDGDKGHMYLVVTPNNRLYTFYHSYTIGTENVAYIKRSGHMNRYYLYNKLSYSHKAYSRSQAINLRQVASQEELADITAMLI